ncbi:MAG: flagellar M-ring protein FliF C-terminal domain-containing protein [Candidatus Velthaea sp.]
MNVTPMLARVLAAPLKTKALYGAFVLAAVGLVAASFALTRDDRIALFAAPLSPDQVGEVQTRLAAWNVAYAPGADNVRVAPAKRSDILLRLSIAGVPHAHLATSAELFAHAGALTPQSVLEAQTRDGLASDLALGLRGLDGVADARVIIAPARTGMYADEASHDASASVRITLANGARMNARTLAGIRAFVAGGVPGLDAAHVTVLDDRGLAPELGSGAEAGGDGDDDGIAAALQSALDAAFGPNVTIVRVHRDLIAERRDVHDVRRTALGGTLSRSASDERYNSNLKKYTKANSVEERGSDTHDETLVALPGATGRRSVAVFVDEAKGLDLAKIRSLAEAAAGLDPTRGDVLHVEAVRFATPASVRGPLVPAWALVGAFAGVVPQAIVALSLAFAGWFGARPAYALAVKLIDSANVRATSREVAGIPPTRVRGALAGEPPHIAAAIISALPAATATAVLELYPPDERAAIVRRLARAASPLVPDAEELLRARG